MKELLFLFAGIGLCAAETPPPAECQARLSEVVIYPSMARISRDITLELNAGENRFQLSALPQGLLDDTLSGEMIQGEALLSGVNVQTQYTNLRSDTEVQKAAERVQRLEDTLNRIRAYANEVRQNIDNTHAMTPVMPEGFKTQPAPLPFSLPSYRTLSQTLRERLLDRYATLRCLDSEITEISYQLSVAQNDYSKIAASDFSSRKNVILSLKTAKSGPVTLRLSYLTGNASWAPAYDVRVNPENSKVTLSAFGLVRQSTGENWENVPLLLSSANPAVSADLPELSGILIAESYAPRLKQEMLGSVSSLRKTDFQKFSRVPVAAAMPSSVMSLRTRSGKTEVVRQAKGRYQQESVSMMFDQGSVFTGGEIELQDGQTLNGYSFTGTDRDGLSLVSEKGEKRYVPFKQISRMRQQLVEGRGLDLNPNRLIPPDRGAGGFDYRFASARLETLPTDNQYRRILLKTSTLDGKRFYIVRPSFSEHAYLMCRTSNTLGAPILPGPANLFHGSDYIGDFDLPRLNENQSYELALGVDPRIKVTRKIFKNAQESGLFSSKRETRFETEIKIENESSEAVEVQLEEPLPVSESDRLSVVSVQTNPAPSLIADDSNKLPAGLYRWILPLKPASKSAVKLNFTVSVPLNDTVSHRSGNAAFEPGFGSTLENTK